MNYPEYHDVIFEPNHIYIDNRVQENYYDGEASTSKTNRRFCLAQFG